MLSAAASQRFHRVATGTLANILGQGLNIAGQLALVPLLLNYWGTQLYGEWLALSAMVTYLSTLDFGMQTYVINRLNQCYSTNKMAEYTRVLHTGFAVNLAIPLAGFAVAAPFFLFAPIVPWLQLRETDATTAAWVALLLSASVVYSIGFGLLVGIYRTVNEYARGQMIGNVRFFLNVVLTAALAYAGGRLKSLAALQLGLLVATTIFVYLDLVRRRPDIHIGLSQADWRLGLQFIAPSALFLGIQITAALGVQGSTLLVSSMFGASALVVFASLRTLSNMIRQATATLQLALWPEFTSLEAQAERRPLQMMHRLGAKVVMGIAACSTVFLIVVGERLVEFWTRGRVPYNPDLMLAFLVLACSQAHSFCSSILLSACNRHKTVLRCNAIGSVGGFVLGYLLAHPFGVVGFVYGLAAADMLACGLVLPYVACRMVGDSPLRFLREVTVRSVLLICATYAGVSLVFPVAAWTGSAIREFLAAGLMTCALGALVAYLVALNRFERDRLNTAVAAVLTR